MESWFCIWDDLAKFSFTRKSKRRFAKTNWFWQNFEIKIWKHKKTENHNEIIGKDFSVEFFADEELVSNKMLSVYGENGLFELIRIAKEENWQIYDSGTDKMLNLERPEENGYENFRQYLKNILSTE